MLIIVWNEQSASTFCNFDRRKPKSQTSQTQSKPLEKGKQHTRQMPKGRVLSLAEREAIVEMHRAGASGREIAKKLERSKTVVLNFLRDPAQYGQIKRSGRKRALSSEDERRLYVALFRRPPPPAVAREQQEQQALDEEGSEEERLSEALEMDLEAAAVLSTSKSAEQIKREFNLPLSVRRIQQLLSEWRKHARRQVDSHAIGTSDDATESEGADAEHEASPKSEVVEAVSADGEQTAEEDSDQVAGMTATGDREAASDAISSADAMLALPDGKLDAVSENAAPPESGQPDTSKLGEESCLSSLAIDEASTFPELQLSLADDKLAGGASTTAEAGPTPSPAATETEQANETTSTESGEQSQPQPSPSSSARPSSPLPLPAGVLDPPDAVLA